MRFLTRRATTLVVGLVAAVVFVWAAVGVFANSGRSDECRAVDELLEFHHSQLEYFESKTHVPAAGSYDEPSSPSAEDYQVWADGLAERAAAVNEPQLAEHARRVGELATQSVHLVDQLRVEENARELLDFGPPPSLETYAQVSAAFNDEVAALDAACPQHR